MLTGTSKDQPVAPVCSVASTRDRFLFLLPTNCAARAVVGSLQEGNKVRAKTHALEYPNGSGHLDSIFPGLPLMKKIPIVRMWWRLETKCMVSSALSKVLVKSFSMSLFLSLDLTQSEHNQNA